MLEAKAAQLDRL